MATQLLDHTLGNLACNIPGATRVFHAFHLDFCCGGQKSLRQAALERGIDALAVQEHLLALNPDDALEADWRKASAERLIEHLLQRYHEVHRQQLPELIRLAARVEQVHGSRAECPRGLTDLLIAMQQELESHMQKEEQILFPMIIRGGGLMAGGPISVMRYEHDQHGDALERLLELSHGLQLPEHACNTWRALYRGLEELHDDLMQHIHLENNILFLRQ
jgi:regulator of cell morphogenesis and NO signaling